MAEDFGSTAARAASKLGKRSRKRQKRRERLSGATESQKNHHKNFFYDTDQLKKSSPATNAKRLGGSCAKSTMSYKRSMMNF